MGRLKGQLKGQTMYKSFLDCKNNLDGVLSIDFFLASRLCNIIKQKTIEQEDASGLLFHSIMATSQALREGHTCLKLSEEANQIGWLNADEDKKGYQFPDLQEWKNYLSDSTINPENDYPIVYENERLYLRRYWQFENELAIVIRRLVQRVAPIDLEHGKQAIERLFPPHLDRVANSGLDWQKIAVANSLLRQFTIIAGGPGTGKTFTVTKILAALQTLSDNGLKIAMVAPTGKAAQRLNESIQKAKFVLRQHELTSEETLESIPDTASTLHRLLKVKLGSHNFHYHSTNSLPFDVVLVDEISMIDLPLMTRLMRAINPECRVIMLGDADQLPSVAAGSVLSDLAPRQTPGYSKQTSEKLSELTGVDIPVIEPNNGLLNLDHLTVLQFSHRFQGDGEIGLLSEHVISGNSQASWKLLAEGKKQIEHINSPSINDWLFNTVDQYYLPLFVTKRDNSITLSEAFKQLNRFRFLAATRMGDQGVNRINETIEQYLRSKGLIRTQSEYYPGRPIMVTENHYHIGLFNGDTGILWENEDGKLMAAFPQHRADEKDTVRWLSLGRLPSVETVYAMTIHKTQGSEFTHVGLVLPDSDSLILSRELLYTGITRASEKLSVWSDKSIWSLGVGRKVHRYSGLPNRVFGLD